jgi:hypothetical protein
VDVGGGGGGIEDVTAAVEAAAHLLIVISTFANACSTLTKTWLRLSSMCYGPFTDIPAILFLHAWQVKTTGW